MDLEIKMVQYYTLGFPEALNILAVRETWVQSLGQEDTLEEEMATHSSILTSRMPWTEELGEL